MPESKINSSPEDASARAREQAAEYESVFSPTILELDSGETIEIPPNPNLNLLDDDRQEAYEELLFETESYDRGPDLVIPPQKDKDGNVIIEGERLPGPLLTPYRKAGKLVKPPHTVRVVKAVLGEDQYAKLRKGGKSAGDVWKIWSMQGLGVADRQKRDSKSAGSAVDSAPVPEADTP